jgi:outer membrane lipoprotein carrier protein
MILKRGFYSLILVLAVSLLPSLAGGQGIPLEGILDKVQAQYDTHRDFKAQFFQETLIKSLGKKQKAEGKVYFKKPGKMRWIYTSPHKQEIISDGRTLWTYRPEDKQVIVAKAAQAFQSRTPNTFLAGLGNLKRDFQARFEQEPSPGKDYFLEMTPLETHGSLEKLFLQVDEKTFNILRAKIQDVMGNVTEIRFTDIQFDNRLPDDLFTFSPPPGVEVFRMPGAPPAGPNGK